VDRRHPQVERLTAVRALHNKWNTKNVARLFGSVQTSGRRLYGMSTATRALRGSAQTGVRHGGWKRGRCAVTEQAQERTLNVLIVVAIIACTFFIVAIVMDPL
jgi:hypothetical protein